MKYIKLNVQDKDHCNLVFVGIMYLEYLNEKNLMAIYSLNTLDPIYLNVTNKEYEEILNHLSKSDFITINLCGYTQPFESFEDNKKGKKYIELDNIIMKKALEKNKDKKLIING